MTEDVKTLHKGFLRQPFAIDQDIARAMSGQDVELLQKYGCWLEALESGALPIISEAQHHFVEAVNGRTTPTTSHEKVWIRYKNCIARSLIEQSTSGGQNYSRAHGYFGSPNSDAYNP
ncbi:DUF413 domain-containing protein [Candidatus Accumulibacter necessarius]|uniref:DUF413 domain-containing protein n=1 Tax=Candidatus Accumulibacter necessarius TaxID=2954386 RepID=UPI003DAA3377